MRVLLIPDTQVKPGVPLDHLTALGNYIVAKRPDVIVHIGDHWDMQSLSAYDRGKKAAEGRRVQADIDAGIHAMNVLLSPLRTLQARQRRNKKKVYEPQMHFHIGNHEERIMRHVEANAEMEGFLSYDDLRLEEMGWNVHPFLETNVLGGIAFAHYFYNPNTGRPFGGTAHTKLKNIGDSCVMGHQQGLDMATRTTNTGRKQWGIIAGSFYMHEEGYKGPQGNNHFHGVLMLNEVQDGDCAPNVITLEYLLKNYL